MNYAGDNQIKEFIELKCDYKGSHLDRLLKGYDESSSESVLKDIIYYSYDELDIYKNGIQAYLDGTVRFHNTENFTKWLMVARGVIVKNVQLEELSNEETQKLFKLFMKMHNLYTYLNSHTNTKKEVITKPCLDIITYIESIKRR